MSTQTLLLIGLVILVVCWALGAHNRLVRLSNAVVQAYPPVGAQLSEMAQLYEQWLTLAERLPAERRAPLAQEIQALGSALDALRQRPSASRDLTRMTQACEHCERERSALCALPEAQHLADTDPGWHQAHLALLELNERLVTTAQAYRGSVMQFNEAVQEFPAWLIARLAALKPLPDVLESLPSRKTGP